MTQRIKRTYSLKSTHTYYKEFKTLDFRRMDHAGDQLQLTYYINMSDQEQLVRTQDYFRKTYPSSQVSIVEQSNLLGG